ncbi:unnamed protein product, partial [Rotaria sp. Silwood2]
MIRQLKCGNGSTENLPIQDKDGKILINSKDVLARWKENFSDLLNVYSNIDPIIIQNVTEPFIPSNGQFRQDKAPSLIEVEEAMNKMKSGKARGNDGISTDLRKAGGKSMAKWLHEIIVEIWGNEQMVEDWTTAMLIRIYKSKDDRKICDNYKGTSLLTAASQEDPNNVAIFADISAFSNFPEEQEVLFDVGTVFKIEIVKEEKLEDNDILLVVIKTTGEGQDITANYMEVNRREMQEESPKIMLCNLLKKIGKFEKSLKFLKQLQRNPGDENLAHIHNRIGIALKDEKKYEAALEHFQTAFELAYNSEPPQRKYSAFILHNQGLVYAKQNKLNEALRFQQRAMEIVESIGSTNSHFVASYYGSIGRIFSRQKDFDKAMKYFMEAIKISEMSLSTDHVYNAFNFANIATMYARQHKYDEALSYHLMALELRKKYLPSNNYNLGWSLEEVARMYYKKGDSQKALEYYLESLKIARSYTFPSWQHNLIRLLDNIALVYGSG